MFYSFRRLSEDEVLYLALISTWSFAGTEVGSAPQLAGGASWGRQDSAFPWAWPGLQICVFLFPLKSLPPLEGSLIAGQLAAIALSLLQAICACYDSLRLMFSASLSQEITRPALSSAAPFEPTAEN